MTTTRILNRIARFDEESKNYRAVAGIEDKPLRSYSWACLTWNDQGQEGACVGFGFGHDLAARPRPFAVTHDLSEWIYNTAKKLDEFPGENYDGTSVLAGAKAVSKLTTGSTNQKIIDSYTWAFGTEDVVRTIGYKGPVVIGINWYSDMFDVDSKGYLHKSGSLEGGHCTLLRGVALKLVDKAGPKEYANLDLDASYVLIHNSWGKAWGVNGEAKLSLRDLDALLKEDGDACKVVKSAALK